MIDQKSQSCFDDPLFWDHERVCGFNRERAQKILELLPKDVTSVLDVGCGDGAITNQLPSNLVRVGLDTSRSALSSLQVFSVQASALKIPFCDCSFDALLCSEVLEHIPFFEFPRILSEITRVVRRYIIVSVPYREDLNLGRTICPKCGCFFHIHNHVRNFDMKDLERLFQDKEKITPLSIKPILPDNTPIFLNLIRYFLAQPFPLHGICPQCGYAVFKKISGDYLEQSKTNPASLKSLIKSIWPKKKQYRWWIALFQKQY